MVETFGWIISLLALIYLYFKNASPADLDAEKSEEIFAKLKDELTPKKARPGTEKKKKSAFTPPHPQKLKKEERSLPPSREKIILQEPKKEEPEIKTERSKVKELISSTNLKEIIILKELLDQPKGLRND